MDLQIALRWKEGLQIKEGYKEYENVYLEGLEDNFIQGPSIRMMKYSEDGSRLAWCTTKGVFVADAKTKLVMKALRNTENVQEIGFSPQGTYLMTWDRQGKTEPNTEPQKQLRIWKWEVEEIIAEFHQRAQMNWAPHWSKDELIFARNVANEIHIYDAYNLNGGPKSKLRLDGVTQFSLSPSPASSCKLAAFVPEIKGAPAVVRIYLCSQLNVAMSNKSFYNADRVKMIWNRAGSDLLLLTQTDVDKTGKSYYGETHLYLIAANGTFDCCMVFDKDGPIHDVAWHPSSREFSVVYGYMPAKAMLYDNRSKAIFDFGTGARNALKFSPNGKLICFGGFGNLPGEMEVWDRDRLKKISHMQASHASFFEFSPDSHLIMTAILSPRLRVDNGYKIWHCNGSLLSKTSFSELYEVQWRPIAPEKFQDRALTPPPSDINSPGVGLMAIPVKPAVYRPPHLKDRPAPAPLMQRLEIAPKLLNPDYIVVLDETKSDIEKRVKNLEKKLKQIQELKDKQANRQPLELNQVQKISTENSLLEELKSLMIKL